MSFKSRSMTANASCPGSIPERRRGISLWVLRTGAPWRDLPDRSGTWQTISSRFRRWWEAGVWDRVLQTLQAAAAHDDTRDGRPVMIDGRKVRAHQHAAGARKQGAPIRTQAAVAGAGGTARAPAGDSPPGTAPGTAVAGAVPGDQGSRASDLRTWLPARAVDAVIPDWEDESGDHASDREADRERPISERAINRRARSRGIATRYDTLASSSRAMVTIATILAWI